MRPTSVNGIVKHRVFLETETLMENWRTKDKIDFITKFIAGGNEAWALAHGGKRKEKLDWT